MDITARIEKNRVALLAILAPWFAFTLLYWARGTKPLPPRLAAFALETVAKMEKAAGWLLIASVYAALPAPRRTAQFESLAFCLSQCFVHNRQSRVTIARLHSRLIAIWRFVNNLHQIARHLARRLQVQQIIIALGQLSGQSMHDRMLEQRRTKALPFRHDKTGPP